MQCHLGQGQVTRVSDKIYHVPSPDIMSSGSSARTVTCTGARQYHLQLYLGAVASKLKSRWTPLAMLPNLSGDTGISRFFLLDPYLETKQECITARHPVGAPPPLPQRAQHAHALCSHANKLLTFQQHGGLIEDRLS